jgi:hypothetical protein
LVVGHPFQEGSVKKITLMLLSAGMVLATGSIAPAQVYFGIETRPRYYEPPPPPPRRYYRERYYSEPRHYGPPRVYGERRYHRSEEGYASPAPRWRTWNGCPPNFTVQDGVCKPYRGY